MKKEITISYLQYRFIKRILRIFLLFFGLTFIPKLNSIAQDKKIFIELDNTQIPVYTEVKEKGILVSYGDLSKDKKIWTTIMHLSFYDLELNKVWEKKNVYSVSLDVKAFRADPQTYPKTIEVTSSLDAKGGYMYYYQPAKKNVIQVNINDGTIKNKVVENAFPESKYFTLCSGADEDFFYISHKPTEYAKTDKEYTVSVMKFDSKTLNQKISNFEITSVGKSKSQVSQVSQRNWEFLGISKYGVCFVDNYATKLKETKEFFKRVLCYNLDGSLKKDIFVKLGDKIADSDHLGDLIYNVGGKGYLYSYALSRVDGKNLVNYSCYNQKMELEWEKQYDSKIKTGSVKRIISSASIEMLVDSSIVITSYYGLDEMSFKYSNSIKTFEFKLLEYKSQGCEIPFKYGLDCSLYIKLSQYKGCKNFIDGDMKKTKENVTVIPYFTNDRVIISKQTIRMLEIPDQYIALYMFKL